MSLRYPELGKEYKINLSVETYLEDLNYFLISVFGIGSDAFILLNEDGVSIKDKSKKVLTDGPVYAFLKESIKKEKSELIINFELVKTQPELPLEGEERGVLITEKILHKLYMKSLDYSDYFNSYSGFVDQLNKEMSMINEAIKVLSLYHTNHIQEQIENFNALHKKNLSHFTYASEELKGFEEAVEKLGSFAIHPKLRGENRQKLSQLIDTPQLCKWKESYVEEIGRLQNKFKDLEKLIKQLPGLYQLPHNPEISLKCSPVNIEILTALNFNIELYLEYKELCVNFMRNDDASAGARLHEEQWEKKSQQARQNLLFAEKSMNDYKENIENAKRQRKAANSQLFALLRKITEFASRMRDTIKSQLAMLSSLLKRSEKKLSFIKVPKLLPEAHDSTILEISRRNYFVRTAGELQKQLNSLIEIEIAERLEFLEKYRYVLPNNFIPQLSAAPFIKIIEVPEDSDLTLPQIFGELPGNFVHKERYLGTKSHIESEDSTEISKKYNEVVEMNKSLIQEKETFESRIKTYLDNISNYALKEKDYITKIKELQNSLHQTNTKILDLQEERVSFEVKENEMASEIEKLRNLVKNYEQEISSYSNNDKKSEQNIKDLDSTIKSIRENEKKLVVESEKNKETIKKLSLELKTKEKLIIDTANELKKLYEEFKEKENKLVDINNQLLREKKNSEGLFSQLSALREKYEESTRQLSSLKLENEAIISDQKALKNIIETLRTQFAEEKVAKEELQKTLASYSKDDMQELYNELSINGTISDLRKYITQLKESELSKISFTFFNEGSLALFFPTVEGQFLAFNYNCPDHYLNIDSLSDQSIETLSTQPYIVGLITEKKKQIAEKGNLWFIPQGKEFYLLSIKEQPI